VSELIKAFRRSRYPYLSGKLWEEWKTSIWVIPLTGLHKLIILHCDGLKFISKYIVINEYTYILVFFIKLSIYCMVVILIRAILPRLRFDKLIEICWYYLLPICLVCLFVLAVIIVVYFT
jgi:NADH:ubiquinone oxidoreductase subunit H